MEQVFVIAVSISSSTFEEVPIAVTASVFCKDLKAFLGLWFKFALATGVGYEIILVFNVRLGGSDVTSVTRVFIWLNFGRRRHLNTSFMTLDTLSSLVSALQQIVRSLSADSVMLILKGSLFGYY